MTLIFSLIMGLVQALTEFLPVSSSGHLSILQNLFGVEQVGEIGLLFDVMLHFGTLISVVIMYRREIWDMIKAFFGLFRRRREGDAPKSDQERGSARLILLLVVAALPLFVILLVKDYIESLYDSLLFVGLALIVTGALLFISSRVKPGEKNEKSATILDAFLVGCIQVVATAPGISRSGSTITAGLLRGFDRDFAVRFSFILSIPTVLGANFLTLVDAIKEGIDVSMLPIYFAGVVVAAVVGCFAIKLVRFLVSKGKFGGFAYYCWIVGAAVVIASFFI